MGGGDDTRCIIPLKTDLESHEFVTEYYTKQFLFLDNFLHCFKPLISNIKAKRYSNPYMPITHSPIKFIHG